MQVKKQWKPEHQFGVTDHNPCLKRAPIEIHLPELEVKGWCSLEAFTAVSKPETLDPRSIFTRYRKATRLKQLDTAEATASAVFKFSLTIYS